MKYDCDSRRQIHHATQLGWTLPEAPDGIWLPFQQQQQQNLCTFDILQENRSKHNFTQLDKNHILKGITLCKVNVLQFWKKNVQKETAQDLCRCTLLTSQMLSQECDLIIKTQQIGTAQSL